MRAANQDSAEWASLSGLPVAVYATDADGRLTFYNEAAAALWGRRPVLGVDRWCASPRSFTPDGVVLPPAEGPMAVALRQRKPQRIEMIVERGDGTRSAVLASPAPLFDAAGQLRGGLAVLTEIGPFQVSQVVAQRLAAIVECSDDAIISKDLDGRIITWNKAAEEMFGFAAEEAVGRPITIIIPDDRLHEEAGILARLRRAERIDHFDTVRRRKDGSAIDISLTVSPIRDATGKVVGASKIARDISERKRAQEAQNLLLREMVHRVKNLFAVAAGVVALSVRSARTLEGLGATIQERLGALARAQDLTLPRLADRDVGSPAEASFGTILRTIAVPFLDAEDAGRSRFQFDGPDIPLGPRAVSGLALLLHELTTNAAKYGALSVDDGCVRVRWEHQDDRIHLVWTEEGGPLVVEPTGGEGFGSVLARGTIRGQFGGTLRRLWRPEGLTVEVEMKAESLAL